MTKKRRNRIKKHVFNPSVNSRAKMIIMGAAGRDFHMFKQLYETDDNTEVVAFTATQIPDISGRVFPSDLAGLLYPNGIPIFHESELERLITEHNVEQCIFGYSDVSAESMISLATRVNNAGASFVLPSVSQAWLESSKPVVAVTAVRTGCGKSSTSLRTCEILQKAGKKPVAIRHPMPYGADLNKQKVQRFETVEDLDLHDCTIEEREEYEPYVKRGFIVFAGVDYSAILHEAEKEAGVIIWDGGNNDTPFIKPDLWICVADPFRAGHELTHWPGSVNFACANLIIINKCDTAHPAGITKVRNNARLVNPTATILRADSPAVADKPELLRPINGTRQRALIVEDGPSLTHGDLKKGAGVIVAEREDAILVDPSPYLKGSLIDTFSMYRNIGVLLPAMGYGSNQIKDLENTINAVECDVVVIATPTDITRLLKINKPIVRVSYGLGSSITKQLKKIFTEKGII